MRKRQKIQRKKNKNRERANNQTGSATRVTMCQLENAVYVEKYDTDRVTLDHDSDPCEFVLQLNTCNAYRPIWEGSATHPRKYNLKQKGGQERRGDSVKMEQEKQISQAR